jgi:cysteine dioxygenase
MIMEIEPTTHILDIHHVDKSRDQNEFDELLASLADTLGPSSGLTLEDVNVASLMRSMKYYDSKEGDWAKYAFGNMEMDYTRNLIDEGNGKSNLVRLPYSKTGRPRAVADEHTTVALARLDSW